MDELFSVERQQKCLKFSVNYLCNNYTRYHQNYKNCQELLSGDDMDQNTVYKTLHFLAEAMENEVMYTTIKKDIETFKKASHVLQIMARDLSRR